MITLAWESTQVRNMSYCSAFVCYPHTELLSTGIFKRRTYVTYPITGVKDVEKNGAVRRLMAHLHAASAATDQSRSVTAARTGEILSPRSRWIRDCSVAPSRRFSFDKSAGRLVCSVSLQAWRQRVCVCVCAGVLYNQQLLLQPISDASGAWRHAASSSSSTSDASISLFQFRYDIDTIFTKYRDIDIDIKYVSKMHAFCRL